MIGLLMSLKDSTWSYLAFIPFLMVVKGSGGYKVNYTRLIEAGIIALITAGLSGYILVQKMDIEMGHLEKTVERIDKKVDRIIDDIYKPVIGGSE